MTNTSINSESYLTPPFSLLERSVFSEETEREQKEIAYRIQETLRSFGVQVTITEINQGPVYTHFELKPDAGVRVRKITNLLDDIQFRIGAKEILIEAPIPGKSAVGIDVLNKEPTLLHLRELLESREFSHNDGELPFAVGKDIGGRTVIYDIVRTPHLFYWRGDRDRKIRIHSYDYPESFISEFPGQSAVFDD